MRKLLFVFVLFMTVSVASLRAQTEDENKNNQYPSVRVATSLSDVRYEFVQATRSSTLTFLVDKFSGKVWLYKSRFGKPGMLQEVPVYGKEDIAADKVNYQLSISDDGFSTCMLLNVHTGQLWEYDSWNREFKMLSISEDL